MRTALDASVLLAVLKQEQNHERWMSALQQASAEGPLLLCDVAMAEISPGYGSLESLKLALVQLHVIYSPVGEAAAFLAGKIHLAYRQAGGPRQHLIPDFLIAAHAVTQADRIAAIDRGYLRHYFPDLPRLET